MDWKKGTTYTVGITVLAGLVGLMMRSPITTIPLIIGELAQKMNVSAGSLGILTTLPLVMFMIFSNFASKILKKLGFKKSLLMALALIFMGSILRLIVIMPTVLVGTALIGMGIAYLNVFMPSFVAAYFPNNIGIYTTLYTFSMMGGSAFFNLITAPIVKTTGWWSMLVVLLLVPSFALITWIAIFGRVPERIETSNKVTDGNHQVETPAKDVRIWTNKKAWLFMITFGSQSTIVYTVTAWLPALMAHHHVDAGMIGVIMALFSLMGLPVAMLLPHLLTTLGRLGQTLLILSAGVAGLTAATMFFFQNTSSTGFWITESILIGYAVNLFFIFEMTMFAIKTTTPYQTARLSGMAQAGGYFIAALGPMLYGLAFAANPTGLPQNIAYVVMISLAMIGGLLIVQIKKV